SGDPGFFGIVRRVRAAGLPVRVLPAVSSVAATFARAGLSWDGAAVVSAHGRDLGPALNACRALPVVAVLTAPGAGAAELGAGLAGWSRRLAVAEQLGTPDERLTWTTPEQAAATVWADPHVVLSLAPDAVPADRIRADNQPAAAPAGGWALPESAYAHRASMITKAEVRALVVARLRPRLGRLLWDVGAGSGSVGIECALLGAAVIAVERDPDAPIRANAARHGVDVRVVAGAAPAALDALPDPDAVFVGGGGTDVLAAVAARRPPRVVAALAALDRVAPAVHLLRAAGYAVEGSQLAAARLADLPGGSLRLAATNPVVVLTGELPEPSAWRKP
ncbi:precorrin-6Y C5,15-methyltransferase (decarboxylating) subunit CbiT, partial [Micromonospora sp. DR5-3]